jgi:HJR/Mrr/RecB family endonuclease
MARGQHKARKSGGRGLPILLFTGLSVFAVVQRAGPRLWAVAALISVLAAGIAGLALVWWLRRRRSEREAIRAAGIAGIDAMDGAAFERRLAIAFGDHGWRVRHMGGNGDFGCDLIAEQGKRRLVIQAKRYALGRKVGIAAVQEVHAALSHYRGTAAVVITSSHFTPAARKLAASTRVECWDRDVLESFLSRD